MHSTGPILATPAFDLAVPTPLGSLPLLLAQAETGDTAPAEDAALAPETGPAAEGTDGAAGTAAPGAPGAGTGTPPPGWFTFLSSPLLPLILLMIVFYVFIIGGNRKKEKARREMIDTLTRGDRVTTIGGIIGSVVDATADEVVVKVDESSNTKMRFTRSAIANVVKANAEKK